MTDAPLIEQRGYPYNAVRQRRRQAATLLGLGRWYFARQWVGPSAVLRHDLTRNRELDLVFVHVPKCGGISTRERLDIDPGHAPALYYAAELPEIMARGRSFGVCRNPYDRLVSAYHFLKHSPRTTNDRDWAEEVLSPYPAFRDFVKGLAGPVTRSRVLTRLHFFPQRWFLCDARGRPLVGHVARFEGYGAEMEALSERFGLDLTAGHANASRRGDWRDYYDAETEAIAHAMYRRDFEIFGYPRERF